MQHPLQTVIAAAYDRKARAISDYMTTLHSGQGKLTDEQIERLLAAIPAAGLSWPEVQSDLSALEERRKIEQIIKDAEAKIEAADLVITGNAAQIAALDEQQKDSAKPYLAADYRSAGQKIAAAKHEQDALTSTIESGERRLRDMRIESPRAFGVLPEVQL